MAIYLVRHGHAGDRAAWSGDDGRRPLSDKGRRQADHVATLLQELLGERGTPCAAVFSSPAVRCVQTVDPVARDLGLVVKEVPELAEGADAGEALRFALDHRDEQPILCSHGDLIPALLRRLVASGVHADRGTETKKGSLWVLDLDGKDVVRGTYHPPQR